MLYGFSHYCFGIANYLATFIWKFTYKLAAKEAKFSCTSFTDDGIIEGNS